MNIESIKAAYAVGIILTSIVVIYVYFSLKGSKKK